MEARLVVLRLQGRQRHQRDQRRVLAIVDAHHQARLRATRQLGMQRHRAAEIEIHQHDPAPCRKFTQPAHASPLAQGSGILIRCRPCGGADVSVPNLRHARRPLCTGKVVVR
jgi:hypothetical protein